MNAPLHDALARPPIYGPQRWLLAMERRRARRRRAAALIGALGVTAAVALVMAADLSGWAFERAINAIAAAVLIAATFASCELIERLIFGAARLITRPPTLTAPSRARGGGLTLSHHDDIAGALTPRGRADITLIGSHEP
jgi:hypothetical protein